MQKPKLVHLVNGLGLDGTSKVVLSLCHLFNEEYDIHVVALNQNTEIIDQLNLPSSVKIHSFRYTEDSDYSLRGYLTNLFSLRRWKEKYKALIELLTVLNPAILHAHLQPRELMIVHVTPSIKNLVYTDHSIRIERSEYRWVNRWMLAFIYRKIYRIFHLVAVSRAVYDCHLNFNLANKKKIHLIISNSIDVKKFVSKINNISRPLRVIYVARLHPKKGHDTLIRAWSLIKSDSQAELILVGGGEDKARLMNLLKEVEPIHPVEFVGDVADVLPYLQSSHIGVFPSLNEGLPIALLEKMSCSMPVIVSDIQAFRGIIQPYKNGLIFTTGDPVDLSNKLQMLMNDSTLREVLGTQARQTILQNYSEKIFQTACDELYKTLLKI